MDGNARGSGEGYLDNIINITLYTTTCHDNCQYFKWPACVHAKTFDLCYNFKNNSVVLSVSADIDTQNGRKGGKGKRQRHETAEKEI